VAHDVEGRPLSDVADARDGITIAPYEDWMRDPVVDMFVAQYGTERAAQEQHFVRFYEHSSQRVRGIRLVALDERKVVGFQSFFSWPYRRGSRQIEAFQSGNSLVDAGYRGRKIFARLLNHLDRLKEVRPIDFLVGFPVQMSYGSFIRNGWANPLNLAWYARVIHPTSVLFQPNLSTAPTTLDAQSEAIVAHYPDDVYALSKDEDFESWRSAYQHASRHLYFHHRAFGGDIRFALKFNRRGRIAELIVGDVVATKPDPELTRSALRALIRVVRQHRFVTILTVALNRHCRDALLLRELRRALFIPLRPQIYFVVKDFGGFPDITDQSRWRLFRSDIDTW
jgi:GNAT superfamily N-acetyltransferase